MTTDEKLEDLYEWVDTMTASTYERARLRADAARDMLAAANKDLQEARDLMMACSEEKWDRKNGTKP